MNEVKDLQNIKSNQVFAIDYDYNPIFELVFERNAPVVSYTEPDSRTKFDMMLVNPTKNYMYFRIIKPQMLPRQTIVVPKFGTLKPMSTLPIYIVIGQQESLEALTVFEHVFKIQVISEELLELIEKDFPNYENYNNSGQKSAPNLYFSHSFFMNTMWYDLIEKEYVYEQSLLCYFKGNDQTLTYTPKNFSNPCSQILANLKNNANHPNFDTSFDEEYLHVRNYDGIQSNAIYFYTADELASFTNLGSNNPSHIFLLNPTNFNVYFRVQKPPRLNIKVAHPNFGLLEANDCATINFVLADVKDIETLYQPHFFEIQIIKAISDSVDNNTPSSVFSDSLESIYKKYDETDPSDFYQVINLKCVFRGIDGIIEFVPNAYPQTGIINPCFTIVTLNEHANTRNAYSESDAYLADLKNYLPKRIFSSSGEESSSEEIKNKQLRANFEIKKQAFIKSNSAFIQRSIMLDNIYQEQEAHSLETEFHEQDFIYPIGQYESGEEDLNEQNDSPNENTQPTLDNKEKIPESFGIYRAELYNIDENGLVKHFRDKPEEDNKIISPVPMRIETKSEADAYWDMILIFLFLAVLASVLIKDLLRYHYQLKKKSTTRYRLAKLFGDCWPFNQSCEKNSNNKYEELLNCSESQ